MRKPPNEEQRGTEKLLIGRAQKARIRGVRGTGPAKRCPRASLSKAAVRDGSDIPQPYTPQLLLKPRGRTVFGPLQTLSALFPKFGIAIRSPYDPPFTLRFAACGKTSSQFPTKIPPMMLHARCRELSMSCACSKWLSQHVLYLTPPDIAGETVGHDRGTAVCIIGGYEAAWPHLSID